MYTTEVFSEVLSGAKDGKDYYIIRSSAVNPILQIEMLGYNHDKYLAQAIESVLMQKTDYTYEIVIHEDCSTDRSLSIALEYQKQYPDRIMVIHWNHNVYKTRQGLFVKQYLLKAKYIAILEGDDYWTDSEKMQKQICFLETHPEYIGITGNVRVVNEDGSKQHRDYHLYPFRDNHIYGKKNALRSQIMCQIAALMYRNIWVEWSTDDFNRLNECKANGDMQLFALLGIKGDVFYSEDIYADHRRVFEGASWTAYYSKKDADEKKAIIEESRRSIREYVKDVFNEEMQVYSPKYIEGKNAENMIRLYDMWIMSKAKGRQISDELRKKGIGSVVIYGMSFLGLTLFRELAGTEIKVLYAIDQDDTIKIPGVQIYQMIPKNIENPDVVVITALMSYDSLEDSLHKKGYTRIIGIDDLIYSLFQ